MMSDPITQSYFQSDALGRLIFIGLWLLSMASWILIAWRSRVLWRAQKSDKAFEELFEANKHHPLQLGVIEETSGDDPAPVSHVWKEIRAHTLALLAKNRQFGASYLSMDDMQMIAERADAAIQLQLFRLEAYISYLSMIMTLGPFVGLLGTVWGILISLGSMQTASNSNDAILSGLAMALATTVIGLVVAIPALIGHHLLKNKVRQFESQLSEFSTKALITLELQYRKVDKE